MIQQLYCMLIVLYKYKKYKKKESSLFSFLALFVELLLELSNNFTEWGKAAEQTCDKGACDIQDSCIYFQFGYFSMNFSWLPRKCIKVSSSRKLIKTLFLAGILQDNEFIVNQEKLKRFSTKEQVWKTCLKYA